MEYLKIFLFLFFLCQKQGHAGLPVPTKEVPAAAYNLWEEKAHTIFSLISELLFF